MISLYGLPHYLIENKTFDLIAFGLQDYKAYRSDPSDIYMLHPNGSVYILKLCDYSSETLLNPP